MKVGDEATNLKNLSKRQRNPTGSERGVQDALRVCSKADRGR